MRVETARNVQSYYTPFARFCLSGNMKSILNNSAAVPLPDRFAHGGQCPLTHRFAHATRRLCRIRTASRTQPDSSALGGASSLDVRAH